MSYKIPLAFSHFTDEDAAAVSELFRIGRLTQGDRVAEFERAFAEFHNVAHAIFVNSGSSANLIAIEALLYRERLAQGRALTGGAGGEAIIQGLNWPSTLTPLLNRGLTPVFCDVEIDSLNASVQQVDAVCTEKTRIVVAVPVLGNPSHLDALARYCDERDLLLHVDACESLGATLEGGGLVGSVGATSAFSFYFSHHMTTIEGGAVLTDNLEVAEFCRALRSHGWSRDLNLPRFETQERDVDSRFRFVMPGYNVRATEINAVLGLSQLRDLPSSIDRRRLVAKGRLEALSSRNSVMVPGAGVLGSHSWMTFPMLFESQALRDRARDRLEIEGVETRPIIVGNVLRQPLMRGLERAPHQRDLPNCDAVFERGLMIGLNPRSDAETETWLGDVLAGLK